MLGFRSSRLTRAKESGAVVSAVLAVLALLALAPPAQAAFVIENRPLPPAYVGTD